MSPSATPAMWQRLGELLVRRRVELDPRYQNRTVFTAERGLDYRLAYDIEEARRTNFRKTTLAGIAVAYAVTLDSLYNALQGGELEAASSQGLARPPVLRPVASPPSSLHISADDSDAEIERKIAGDETLEILWRLLNGEGTDLRPRSERIALIQFWIRHTAETDEWRNGATG